jgi:hypothetical protein
MSTEYEDDWSYDEDDAYGNDASKVYVQETANAAADKAVSEIDIDTSPPHVGNTAPTDLDVLWFDTSDPDNLLLRKYVNGVWEPAAPTDFSHLTGLVQAGQIQAGSIQTGHIAAGQVVTNHIQAGAITAGLLNVTSLSAITADLGTVTAGTITGVYISGSTIYSTGGSYGEAIRITDGSIEYDHPQSTTNVIPYIKMKPNNFYNGDVLVNRGNGNISIAGLRHGTGSNYGTIYIGYVSSSISTPTNIYGQLTVSGAMTCNNTVNMRNDVTFNGGSLYMGFGNVVTSGNFRGEYSTSEMEAFIFKANAYTSYFQALSNNGMRVQNLARSAYLPCYASSYPGASKREWKTNIRDFEGSALDLIVNEMRVKNYQYIGDFEETDDEGTFIRMKDKSEVITRSGLILDEAPIHVVVGEGVDTYALGSINTKGIQELNKKVDDNYMFLLDKINSLSKRINTLEGAA